MSFGGLAQSYWWIVVVAGVFALARFSEAFLVLKAQAIGLPIALVPAVLVVMNIAYAFSTYPVGILADRADRVTTLIVGLLLRQAKEHNAAWAAVCKAAPRPRFGVSDD